MMIQQIFRNRFQRRRFSAAFSQWSM